MLSASRERVEALPADARVLDVGGWAAPLARADWVLDLMGWETRGLYGSVDPAAERFTAQTWVQRDICSREPWPFADRAFDLAVCSHTLEDVRDPIWVCSELSRVARAGYVEVPSRLEEQSYGVHGDWVGWGHHHWLVDVAAGGLEFVFKPHILVREDLHFPAGFGASLRAEERVTTLWWEGEVRAWERVFVDPSLDDWLREPLLARGYGRTTAAVRKGRLRRFRRGR
ncbi:MAG: class I SAM-dependent methyltransferase [Solirubrobacteraceae bacterium MAG38_C4-C5]|nr:class I SAM-dependent methyltransferase [Candidatus Siliceabacter maunaloa]